jgi:hypothetical protein
MTPRSGGRPGGDRSGRRHRRSVQRRRNRSQPAPAGSAEGERPSEPRGVQPPDGDRQLARSGPAERSAEHSYRTGVQPVRRRSGMGGTRPRQGVPAGGKSKGMWTRNQCTLIPAGTSCGASSTTAACGARGWSAKRKATSDGAGRAKCNVLSASAIGTLYAARAGRGVPTGAETEPARNSLIARRAMRCERRAAEPRWVGVVAGGGVGRDGSRHPEGRERSPQTTRRKRGVSPANKSRGNTRTHAHDAQVGVNSRAFGCRSSVFGCRRQHGGVETRPVGRKVTATTLQRVGPRHSLAHR